MGIPPEPQKGGQAIFGNFPGNWPGPAITPDPPKGKTMLVGLGSIFLRDGREVMSRAASLQSSFPSDSNIP